MTTIIDWVCPLHGIQEQVVLGSNWQYMGPYFRLCLWALREPAEGPLPDELATLHLCGWPMVPQEHMVH